jgi:uncharacterized protein (TIGR03083 family)
MSMQPARYLECLAADAARMRDVAARDLSTQVPSCPDWSTADLVRHTATVYLHKAECMRQNAFPKPWPPPGLASEEPLALFDRAYADLLHEFDVREPNEATVTWYPPEQTVGFWIRRMAQETVIHRVDAELAQGDGPTPIPADLAVDGVDEVLERFLAYQSTTWRSEFGELLDDCDGRAVRVNAGDRSWLARLAAEGVSISASDDGAAASVSGAPDAVLLWLWRRAGDDTVKLDGDASVRRKLWQLLGATTQ